MKSKSKSKPLECSYCDKTFKFMSEKKRHEMSHNPQFECKICQKKFSFLSAVRRHEKQHKRSGNVKCDLCGGSFLDETLLKRHMQYAHKGVFSCTQCSAVFNSDSALCVHMKRHRPPSERPYRCSFQGCDKTFNFSIHYKQHIMTHTNEKKYFCDKCDKGFIQQHHLKFHLKHHEGGLPCLAPGCDKRFSSEYTRKRHMAALHKNQGKLESGDSPGNTKHSTDGVLCVHCNKYITKKKYLTHKCYDKHSLECTKTINDIENTKNISPEDIFNTEVEEIVLNEKVIDKAKKSYEDENQNEAEYTCKTVLGGCLIKDKIDGNDSCVCAQMAIVDIPVPEVIEDIITDVMNENNDNGNIKNDNSQINSVKIDLNDEDLTRNTPSCERTTCSGCECYNTCENRIEQDEQPKIDYTNGTVKINPTDLSIDNNKKVSKEAILTNCKDVLGNCIVSGDSTMGEGCFCAKMAMDDRQVIEQQIEEITPHPETTYLE